MTESEKREAERRKAEKKERRLLRRHRRVFAFLRVLLGGFFRRKFNYSYDSLAELKGPYLLLANHNMELDPALVGIAAKHQLYFVASEHITRKGIGGWILKTFFRPIIHTKGKTGARSVMEIIKTLKRGSSVCLFAEGNRSFNGVTGDILPATGKLARAAGASLVTFRLEGGYLTQPRFSLSLRKGKIFGRLVHVYTPEELKAMSEEEMNAAIVRDLHEDAYETEAREKVSFRGRNLTEGIESTLFYCPSCGAFSTLKSTKDAVQCSCGFRAVYGEYGELTCSDGVTRNMRDWDQKMHEELRRRVLDGSFEGFTDEISVRLIGADHKAGAAHKGILQASLDGISFDGTKLTYDDIAGVAIFSRNFMNIIVGAEERQYDVRGELNFCALKYMYLWKMMKEELQYDHS